ncbi:MAG: hypothetical protein AAGJ74_15375 [Pseudomonadota bacterium]
MVAQTADPIALTGREAERKPPRTSWALMGDIGAARGGVPEILIEWRRARGEDDPAPQLPSFLR